MPFLERERFNAKAREWSGSRQSLWQQCESCERCLSGTHLRRLLVFLGTIGTDIADVGVAVGGEKNLMYVSKADVMDLRKPQPGFASLWIRSSQQCALRINKKSFGVVPEYVHRSPLFAFAAVVPLARKMAKRSRHSIVKFRSLTERHQSPVQREKSFRTSRSATPEEFISDPC